MVSSHIMLVYAECVRTLLHGNFRWFCQPWPLTGEPGGGSWWLDPAQLGGVWSQWELVLGSWAAATKLPLLQQASPALTGHVSGSWGCRHWVGDVL